MKYMDFCVEDHMDNKELKQRHISLSQLRSSLCRNYEYVRLVTT